MSHEATVDDASASTATLERFLAAARDGYWEWDAKTDELFMSRTAQALYGLSHEDVPRRPSEWCALIKRADDGALSRNDGLLALFSATATTPEIDVRVRQPDGSARWVKSWGQPRLGPSGELLHMVGGARDIDDQKLLQLELERMRELYTHADAAGAGHTDWIVATDTFYASPRLLEIMGQPPNTKFDGRAGFTRMLPFHPQDRERVVQAMTANFRNSATSRIAMEMRFIVRGQVRWVYMTGVFTRDTDGKLLRWNAAITDITDRKHAELLQRESEERFALAVAASADGIWDWDVINDALFMSERAQRICGLEPGPSSRRMSEWSELIVHHPDEVEHYEALNASYLAGSATTYAADWRLRQPDDSYRWVRVRGSCLRDAMGKPTRVTGFVSDVDAQKRAEGALRRSQRLEAMGTLAGGIAHDFNNILGAILGYGEMALRGVPAASRLRRDLHNIVRAGERGRDLVARILTFSRSGVGERTFVNVEEIVREALDLVAAKLPSGIRIEADLQASGAGMYGHPTQVHQVLMNLATNAVHAMPSGGLLRVSLKAEQIEMPPRHLAAQGMTAGAYLVLKVCDTGLGIPQHIVERIFDPFFTTRDAGVGAGLGLSIVHGIVTEVGGTIDFVTAVGKGSTFTVYLRHAGDASPAIAHDDDDDESVTQATGRGQRILVVDDEQALVELTAENLKEMGYAPVTYTSSQQALSAFRADPMGFDAVITDERMPGLSGSSLIEELRVVRPSQPILLVTGFVGDSPNRDATADEVLKKPLSTRALAASLARVLRSA